MIASLKMVLLGPQMNPAEEGGRRRELAGENDVSAGYGNSSGSRGECAAKPESGPGFWGRGQRPFRAPRCSLRNGPKCEFCSL